LTLRPRGKLSKAATEMGLGEIGQAHATRLLDLAKHDVLVTAMQGFPFRHAPLQRAPQLGPDTIGMAPRQFIEQADRAQTRVGLQQPASMGLNCFNRCPADHAGPPGES
jgi:hypothetical protein